MTTTTITIRRVLFLLIMSSIVIAVLAYSADTTAAPHRETRRTNERNSQPTAPRFFGMNTYFTGLERHFTDEKDGYNGIPMLIAKGRDAGVQWGREEISWASLETSKGKFDEDVQARQDTYIGQMATAGYDIIGMVSTTPNWARVSDCTARLNRYSDSDGYIPQGEIWCPPANVQDYADVMTAVVERYDGDGVNDALGSPRIAVWQLWNEPNHWETWLGYPSEYGALLVAGYQAIKQADPTALVAIAGVYVFDGASAALGGCECHKDGLNFLGQVFTAVPAAWHSFDVMAIHPYMPDIAPEKVGLYPKVSLWGRIVTTQEWLAALAQHNGTAVPPIWISEIGWIASQTTTTAPTTITPGSPNDPLRRYRIPSRYLHPNDGDTSLTGDAYLTGTVTEEEQRDYMVRAHVIAQALGIPHLNYLQLEDKFDGDFFGFVHPWGGSALLRTKAENYAEKPAYVGYRIMTELLANATYRGTGHLHTYAYNPNTDQTPASRFHLSFRATNSAGQQEQIDILWHNSTTELVGMILQPGVTVAEYGTFTGIKTQITANDQGAIIFNISVHPGYVRQILSTPTPTPSPTPTPTATNTPTPSPTPTPTATNTPTPSPTPTPILVPGDNYEPDDACAIANTISPDGMVQTHTFHVPGDSDWIRFDATAGTTYLIMADVAPNSAADVALAQYGSCDATAPADSFDRDPTNMAHMTYTAMRDTSVFFKITNSNADTAGVAVSYMVSVRALPATTTNDAAIIVGSYVDPTQYPQQTRIINNATQTVQTMLTTMGYQTDHITLLDATSASATAPTLESVQAAIVTWAPSVVANGGTLTLYVAGDGQLDVGDTTSYIYINRPLQQKLTPTLLNEWLHQLESTRPDIHITVVIEAAYAGGFVPTVAANGRVVVTATNDEQPTITDNETPLFTWYLADAAKRGASVQQAYQRARWAVQTMYPWQEPLLNDMGSVGHAAYQRGYIAYTSLTALATQPFAPYIEPLATPQLQTTNRGVIQATIHAQKTLNSVRAYIFPPTFSAPQPAGGWLYDSGATILMLAPATQLADTIAEYIGTYDGFNTPGDYRVVVYGVQENTVYAMPASVTLSTAHTLYLPIVLR